MSVTVAMHVVAAPTTVRAGAQNKLVIVARAATAMVSWPELPWCSPSPAYETVSVCRPALSAVGV